MEKPRRNMRVDKNEALMGEAAFSAAKKVSLVLPAFNEKENLTLLIPALVKTLMLVCKEYEIILVDDGSTDGTPEIALDFSERIPAFKYLRFKHNHGLSSALAAGYKFSSGEIVVTMDSDLQYDPEEIPALLRELAYSDLVCGWRDKRKDSVLKYIASKIANSVRQAITKDNFNDGGCIFRAFRKECLQQIELFNGFQRFLPILFKMKGFRVAEVRVRHLPRRFGKSKFGIRNRIFVAFFDALMVFWMQKRQINYEIAERINC